MILFGLGSLGDEFNGGLAYAGLAALRKLAVDMRSGRDSVSELFLISILHFYLVLILWAVLLFFSIMLSSGRFMYAQI
jgi:hypothetical protein